MRGESSKWKIKQKIKNVQKFLYDVMETDNEKFNILEELRNSVFYTLQNYA